MLHIINTFKLMSDETRLRIITLLSQDELCVCQLTGITGLAQPKISKALSKLRDLNLVEDRREDKFVYYTLKKDASLFSVIIKEIIQNIHTYPMLLEDQQKLELKETFLNNCNSTITIK